MGELGNATSKYKMLSVGNARPIGYQYKLKMYGTCWRSGSIEDVGVIITGDDLDFFEYHVPVYPTAQETVLESVPAA